VDLSPCCCLSLVPGPQNLVGNYYIKTPYPPHPGQATLVIIE